MGMRRGSGQMGGGYKGSEDAEPEKAPEREDGSGSRKSDVGDDGDDNDGGGGVVVMVMMARGGGG